MEVNEIVKLVQLYMYQGMYSNSNESGTSEMFQFVLLNALKSLIEKGNTQVALAAVQNGIEENNTSNENKKSSDNISTNITAAIENAASKYGVDKDFIKAVIKNESSFNPQALSKSGAMGLMQLMPSTAKALGVENPFDVLENIDGGTRYLKRLMNEFGGSKELALSAYNGGIGRMNKLGVDTVEEIGKMPSETRNYVNRVISTYNSYKKL